ATPHAYSLSLHDALPILIPGVSSAGITEDLRTFTPAADTEVVKLGAALCLPMLPSNPLGAPGPSGITRAALCLAGLDAAPRDTRSEEHTSELQSRGHLVC